MFVITASKVQTRSIPGLAPTEAPAPVNKPFPTAKVALIIVLIVTVSAGVLFRERIFNPGERAEAPTLPSQSPAFQPSLNIPPSGPPTSASAKWMLNLDGLAIPDSSATGIVHGKTLIPERVILDGGTLTLRTANPGVPDVGVSIYLRADRSEEFAGQAISIRAESGNAPWVNLRWKDESGEAVTETVKSGYAMRIEFGQVAGNRLPGKIYLCTPDKNRSWVAGSFVAEIRKPQN